VIEAGLETLMPRQVSVAEAARNVTDKEAPAV
jgi:hypothetical protein